MGRGGVSGAEGRNRRRRHGGTAPRGLRIIERDGHWHIVGTVRAGGRSRRIRQSTGLPARSDTIDNADALRQRIEHDFTAEVVHGIKPLPRIAFSVAAERYLFSEPGTPLAPVRPPGPRTIEAVRALDAILGSRILADLGPEDWRRALDLRLAGRKPATRQRFISAIVPFWRYCVTHGWLRAMPEVERPKLPPRTRHRARRRVAEITPDLLAFVFSFAPLHLRAQLYIEWTTGARVSSVIHGCRLCDVILAEGREQITFHDTKNGDSVTAAIHPAAAAVLREYLQERGLLHRQEWPLFLTPKRRPYSPRAIETGRGGQNKTAWRRMIRRARKALWRRAAELRAAGDRQAAWTLWGQAALVGQMTQHWLRHWVATHALAGGMDPRSIMEQGGWRTMQAVMAYQHDVPDARRRAVNALPIGTSLTRSAKRSTVTI